MNLIAYFHCLTPEWQSLEKNAEDIQSQTSFKIVLIVSLDFCFQPSKLGLYA